MSVRCSVIIPSRNRRALLERLLDALAAEGTADDMEAVVVLDGSTDGSAEMLAARQQSGRLPRLQWMRQERQGQAAARTAGATLAAGTVLIFLDDDVIPSPGLVKAHLRWHAANEPVAVFGTARVQRDGGGLYQTVLWAWWEDTYYTRALPGRRPGYRDFCAGNVSLRRDDFFRAGGFDPAFRGYGGEDYDLGYRLLRAGVRFITEPAAEAAHHHVSSLDRILRNVRQEGASDVLFGRKHPELRRSLRLMARTQHARLVFTKPRRVDAAAHALRLPLRLYERLLFRMAWRKLFGKLRHHAYWCGVRDALGTWEAYKAYCAEAPPVATAEIDVTDGVPAVPPALWVEGPLDLTVRALGRDWGTIRIKEPITGPVGRTLAEELLVQMTPALRRIRNGGLPFSRQATSS